MEKHLQTAYAMEKRGQRIWAGVGQIFFFPKQDIAGEEWSFLGKRVGGPGF